MKLLRISGISALLVCILPLAATAQDRCSTYPARADDSIASANLEAEFGAVPEAKEGLRFVYVAKTLINEYWQDVAKGVELEGEARGIKIDIQAARDESSMLEQLNMAQTVLRSKPDAMLLSPQSDSNLSPVIKAAREANIPTVVLNDARTSGAAAYIGPDQVGIGAAAADWFAEVLPGGGKVAQIEGAAGSPNARKRIDGFTKELATLPNLELVASQPGNWDRMTALNATSNILRQNPDIVGIYANNDGMALGVYEAVANAGLADQVMVIGTDGIKEARNSISEGKMAATVAEFPELEGRLGVQVALRLLNCQDLPNWIVSPHVLVAEENVDTYVDDIK